MKILNLSVLAGVVATPAMACDLCSIYSAMQARGEVNKGFTLGVAEQFTHYGALQEDGHQVPNSLNQHLDSSISQLFAACPRAAGVVNLKAVAVVGQEQEQVAPWPRANAAL